MGCPKNATPKHNERSFLGNVWFYTYRSMLFLLSLISTPVILLVSIILLFDVLVLENKLSFNDITNKLSKKNKGGNSNNEDIDTEDLEVVG